MRRNICIVLAAVVCVFCAAQATAKVYWLPDYLKDNADRLNNHFKSDGALESELTCPSGCITFADKGNKTCAYAIPVSGIGNCYCECENSCNGLKNVDECDCVLESNLCPGQCEECRQSCNTETYPYTSNNCRADMLGGTSCTDTADTHYEECYCQGEVDAGCGKAQTCEDYCDPNEIMCTKCSDPLNCGDGSYWNEDFGCVDYDCPSGYATTADKCGSIINNGYWALGTTKSGQSGDDFCYQCKKKCNSGFGLINGSCVDDYLQLYIYSSTTTGTISLTIGYGKYMIDWGDGNVESGNASNVMTISHQYSSKGLFDLTINGNFTKFALGTMSNIQLKEIKRLNLSSITDGAQMFYGKCGSTTGTIPELPKNLVNGAEMFRRCTGFTGFGFTEFPRSLTNGSYMFQGTTNLKGSVPKLSPVLTDGSYMFNGSGITGLSFTALPTTLTNGQYMFYGCTSLTGSLPILPDALQNGYAMFGRSKLSGEVLRLPDSLTNVQGMFNDATNITADCLDKPSGITSKQTQTIIGTAPINLSTQWNGYAYDCDNDNENCTCENIVCSTDQILCDSSCVTDCDSTNLVDGEFIVLGEDVNIANATCSECYDNCGEAARCKCNTGYSEYYQECIKTCAAPEDELFDEGLCAPNSVCKPCFHDGNLKQEVVLDCSDTAVNGEGTDCTDDYARFTINVADLYDNGSFTIITHAGCYASSYHEVVDMDSDKGFYCDQIADAFYYHIDCGNGLSIGAEQTSGIDLATCEYSETGEYDITISGRITGFKVHGDNADMPISIKTLKLNSIITSYLYGGDFNGDGSYDEGTGGGMFEACSNLVVSGKDLPDILPPNIINGNRMFCECPGLTGKASVRGIEGSLEEAVSMFGSTGLTELDMDISAFTKIRNVQSMFSGTTILSGDWNEKPSSLNCGGSQNCFDIFNTDSNIRCHNSWKEDITSDAYCDSFY